jgi:hypothetical protein
MAKKNQSTKISKKTCFVIGPIGEEDSEARVHADWLLEEVLKPTFEYFSDFTIERSDKSPQPGMIDSHIIHKLRDSELVVADLSFLNANVFYEIGIRHMFQKPIIHMQLKDNTIPFDVSLYRAIKFSFRKPADLKEAREDLRLAIAAVLAEGYVLDNPITRAIGQINFQEHATPEQEVLLEKMSAIEKRISSIEASTAPKQPTYIPSGKFTAVDAKFDPSQTNAGDICAVITKHFEGFIHITPALTEGGIEVNYPGVKYNTDRAEAIEKSLKAVPGFISVKIMGK